jgi:hypothetical protein
MWLGPGDKLALYRYFLRVKRKVYLYYARELAMNGNVYTSIANGEILFTRNDLMATYSYRKIGKQYWNSSWRSVRDIPFTPFRFERLIRMMAQAEVEMICNYPLPGYNEEEEGSFSFYKHAFYDLRFYIDHFRAIGVHDKHTHSVNPEIMKLLVDSQLELKLFDHKTGEILVEQNAEWERKFLTLGHDLRISNHEKYRELACVLMANGEIKFESANDLYRILVDNNTCIYEAIDYNGVCLERIGSIHLWPEYDPRMLAFIEAVSECDATTILKNSRN